MKRKIKVTITKIQRIRLVTGAQVSPLTQRAKRVEVVGNSNCELPESAPPLALCSEKSKEKKEES
jgi:hypothetical protein